MAFGGSNRRQNKRFSFQTKIVIQKERSSLNSVDGVTRDLSLGGASCLISSVIKVFTIVNLSVIVENHEPVLDVSGRVTWVREVEDEDNELGRSPEEIEKEPNVYVIGVQFLTLYSTKKEQLKKILDAYGKQ